MTWRGSTDVKDRIFAALTYLLPLTAALMFGVYLFRQFPIIGLIFSPLFPLIFLSTFPLGIIIFFALFLGVVRNDRINHFIRFNAMQAILIDILLFLFGAIINWVFARLGVPILTETLYNAVFLGAVATCVYAIVQSALGRYAEIPTISEAAYSQVRY